VTHSAAAGTDAKVETRINAYGRAGARAAFLATLLGLEDEVAALEDIDESDGLPNVLRPRR